MRPGRLDIIHFAGQTAFRLKKEKKENREKYGKQFDELKELSIKKKFESEKKRLEENIDGSETDTTE